MGNLLSRYTKDEIITAIESVCDYSTQRLIASYCQTEIAKEEDIKIAQSLAKCKQTKNAYLAERERLINKYGEITKIPLDEKMELLTLQQEFFNAVIGS